MLCSRVFAVIVGLLLTDTALITPPMVARADADNPDSKAEELQANVVKITATLGHGKERRYGFGFIVGEQGGDLVVVTADHVVDFDDPEAGDAAKSPVINFFNRQGQDVSGRLQTKRLRPDSGDLAVILVRNPGFVSIKKEAIDTVAVERSRDVWAVGRRGEWDIPPAPGKVKGTHPITHRIFVEGLAVGAGSSGGPLISRNGIVGMIVADGNSIEATPIAAIQTQVRDGWHYPWELTTRVVVPPRPPDYTARPSRPPDYTTRPPDYTTRPSRPPDYPEHPKSFSCEETSASTSVRSVICEDTLLTHLDVLVFDAYKGAYNRLLSAERQRLVHDQLQWYKERDSCDQYYFPSDCIKEAYQNVFLN
jgi:hypothetical protein